MDAFAKSDDERDFYLDTLEGFLVFVDLDKIGDDLDAVEELLKSDSERFRLIPKMSYFESKKFMEGFVNEKVYDIDTKEKLLDIIQAKEAKDNFLEFIYDNLTELEKWQQYYHERSRIRIIEWLRDQGIAFAFEEDLDLQPHAMHKVKEHLFEAKVSKEVEATRKAIEKKASTYYSNEALNPRPKRGRPPKQVAKVEVEPQLTPDMYTEVPSTLRPYLFRPEYSSSAAIFSEKFDSEAQLLASLRGTQRAKVDTRLEALSERLASLRTLSAQLKGAESLIPNQEHKTLQAVSDAGEGSKISQFAQNLIPGRKKGEKKSKADLQELAKKKREAGVKRVSHIKGKGKKS
jgi:hypothetical protein